MHRVNTMQILTIKNGLDDNSHNGCFLQAKVHVHRDLVCDNGRRVLYIDLARLAGGDVKQWKQRSEDGGTEPQQ
jgi:hypothetical protein